MAERKTREEKMSAVQQKLENGVREIFSSEKYKEYIAAMSKFPRYSINNCILIASQYPEASLVCGYRKWQKEFNRVVNKGEKGIMILAPSKGKVEVEEELYDENHKAVLDENGKQKTEIVTKEYQTFIPVYVFDVSQTQGDPLPSLATELSEQYMNEAKKWMLENISNSGEVEEIDPDLWFVEDREFRDRVIAIVADINEAIKNHTETASRENVIDILKNDDWIAKLKKYVNPNDLRYVQDISVFSKAPSAQWLKNMHKASPKDIDDFRELLEYIYPRGVRRNSYIQDADTIKAIIEGLRKIKEDDLIKKACIRWLGAQFEAIVKLHEPQIEQKTE